MNHRNLKTLLAALLVIALSVFALACGDDDEGSTTSSGDGNEQVETQKITVTLANPSGAVYFPYYAAIDQGFFAEEGLEIETQALDGSGANLQALAAGQAEIVNPGPGPVLNAAAQGQDVVMFYNHIARNILGIWVEEDSEVQAPADLRGARLGVGTAEGVEVGFVKGVLADAGLKEGDYELITVGDGGGAVAGLNGNDIDAYVGGGVDIAIMRQRGIALRNVAPDEYLWAFANGFATKGDYIEKNPEVIEGFGRALTRGLLWARENMDQAQEIAAEANPEEGEDAELARSLIETTNDTFYEPLEGNDFGFFPPDAWEKQQEQALDAGDLDKPLENLESVYTNDFVDAFNEDVEGGS